MEENLRLLKPYVRGLPLIILSMIIAVVVAKKYLTYVTPMYQSTGMLKLADNKEGTPSSNLFKELDVFATANKIAAEIEVIKSSDLINKALDSIDFETVISRAGKLRTVDLYQNSPLRVQRLNIPHSFCDKKYTLDVFHDSTYHIVLPNQVDTIRGTFLEPINIKGASFILSLNEEFIAKKPNVEIAGHYHLQFLSRIKLVHEIEKNLNVTSTEKDVAILRISYKSTDPQKAADFVNTLVKTYIRDYIQTKYQTAEVTVNFLDKQIIDIASKLSDSEATIRTYRDDQEIFNIRQETETELKKISQLRIQLTNEKLSYDVINKIYSEMHSDTLQFDEIMPNLSTFADLISTQLITTLKSLEAEKEKLLITFTPNEERIILVEKQIAEIKKHLKESVGNSRNSQELKCKQLESEIEILESSFVTLPEKERMLTIFNRDFQIYQQSYNYLNEKKIEAEIMQAAKISFHRILAPAHPPKKPVSPNSGLIVIVMAILGMFISILAIMVVHLAKGKVNDAYNVQKNSTIDIALETPMLKKIINRESHFQKQAIQLELKHLAGDKAVIVVSSFKLNEGKTFHACNIAKAFGAQNRKVLLINMLGKLCNIPNVDILNVEYENETLLNKAQASVLIETHKKNYDLIIVNNETVEQLSRALLMMDFADTNLYLLDTRRTAEKQIANTEVLRDEFNIPSFHFVLNKAGYNPNVIIYVFEQAYKLFHKYMTKKRKA